MVGSERALSEVDRLRLMVSVKVGRLPLSSTAKRDTRMTLTATTSNTNAPMLRRLQRTPAAIERVHGTALADGSATLHRCLSQSQGLRWNANDFDGDDSKDGYRCPIQGTRGLRDGLEKISGSVTTLTRAWDNAEPQSGNSRDSYKAGECRLCTGRLQNDFGNDSDPSLHCGVAEGARRVWDKDDEFKSARARRPKGQCRGNAHKGSNDVSYHCADSEAKGDDPDARDFDQHTPS